MKFFRPQPRQSCVLMKPRIKLRIGALPQNCPRIRSEVRKTDPGLFRRRMSLVFRGFSHERNMDLSLSRFRVSEGVTSERSSIFNREN